MIGKDLQHPLLPSATLDRCPRPAAGRSPGDLAAPSAAEQRRKRLYRVAEIRLAQITAPAGTSAASDRPRAAIAAPAPSGSSSAPERLVEVEIADHRHPRHQQAGADRRMKASVTVRTARVLGSSRVSRARPRSGSAIARQQPGDERIGEATMRGDGIDLRVRSVAAQPSLSAASVGAIAAGVPTSNHCPVKAVP